MKLIRPSIGAVEGTFFATAAEAVRWLSVRGSQFIGLNTALASIYLAVSNTVSPVSEFPELSAQPKHMPGEL